MILLQCQAITVRVHRIERVIMPGIELDPVNLAVMVPVMLLDPVSRSEKQAVAVTVLIGRIESVLIAVPIAVLIRRVYAVAILIPITILIRNIQPVLIPVTILIRNIDPITDAVEIARLGACASSCTTTTAAATAAARLGIGTCNRKCDG